MEPPSVPTPHAAHPPLGWIIALLALGMFLLQAGCYLAGIVVQPGELVDADGYTRLLRVHHLAATGDWFSTLVPNSNPLVPETNQWSRWVDLALLAGGKGLGLFLGFREGLFVWGVLFSPFLLALSGMAIAWSSLALPLPGFRKAVFSTLLLFIQPAVLIYLAAGRPDHHGVLLLLLVLVIGSLIRALSEKTTSVRWAIAAGIFQGMALTVSIESLIACILGLLASGLVWLFGRPQGLAIARGHAWSLLATTTLGVASTIPFSHWNLAETDRLSPAFLIPLATVAVFWGLQGTFKTPASTRARLVISLAGALLCLALSIGLVPALLQHPQLTTHPRIGELWVFSVQEYHPLAQTLRDWPAAILIWIGPALAVIPGLAWRVWCDRHQDPAPVTPAYLLAGCVVFAILTLLQIRWAPYLAVFGVLPWAHLLDTSIGRIEARWGKAGWRPAVGRSACILAFALGFPTLGLLGRSLLAAPHAAPSTAIAAAPAPLSNPEPAAPNLRALAAWLNGPDFSHTPPETLLTFLDFGPELLYRTPHHLIATPNHRNADGLLYLYDTLKAPASEARERLSRKNITLIILFPDSHEGQFYLQENPTASFYQDLVAGPIPSFLRPLTPPENLGNCRVYRVITSP
jgi:hypothetical protein